MKGTRNIATGIGLNFVGGSVRDDMRAYDQLPVHIRQMLARATSNVAASPILDFWDFGPGDCIERSMEVALALRMLPQPGSETAETFERTSHVRAG